jgi:CheY-like chemotaxis protein
MRKKGTVLLIDNSSDDTRLAELAFERAELDYSLMVLPDGLAAIDYLTGQGEYADRQRFPLPKLVLLDLALPGLHGFEVLHLLRSQEQLNKVPVTVFSGSDYTHDMNRAYELGANSFLVKPIEFEKFAAALKEAVEYWVEGTPSRIPLVYLLLPQQLTTASQFHGD